MEKGSEEYQKYAKLFWDLQQKSQTPEEEEYQNLCSELQRLSEDFRDELMELEQGNSELRETYAKMPDIEIEKQKLMEEDLLLKNILLTYK